MTKIFPAFPKIWHLGGREVQDLFKSPVEITEKIDGSQFSFGKQNGNVVMRSKGQQIFPEVADKLFKPAVQYVQKLKFALIEGFIYYGETLASPKHNTLSYSRVPKNHIALYGVKTPKNDWITKWDLLNQEARMLDIEVVPLLYTGSIETTNDLQKLLATESCLGNEKVEGIVIKNYKESSSFALSTECYAKLVREEFKERNHKGNPSKKQTFEQFLEQFKTEARWKKAIQHLNEAGKLTYSPQDIGPLIQELNRDLIEEEQNYIKDALFAEFKNVILSKASNGFPEFYKDQLVKLQFEAKEK